MSNAEQVVQIATQVLDRALPRGSVHAVRSEEMVDADGEPALRVTAVVSDAATVDTDDLADARLDAAAQLQRHLSEAGESRFAYLRIATPEELKADALDDEP